VKIRPVTAELFYVDGRTDRLNDANSRYSPFHERTKKYKLQIQYMKFIIYSVRDIYDIYIYIQNIVCIK